MCGSTVEVSFVCSGKSVVERAASSDLLGISLPTLSLSVSLLD